MDSDLSGDFRLAQAFAQQVHGLHPTLLKRIEISSYSSWISHSRKYTTNRTICHYVMQYLITVARAPR